MNQLSPTDLRSFCKLY